MRNRSLKQISLFSYIFIVDAKNRFANFAKKVNVFRNYQGYRTKKNKKKLQINFVFQNPFLPKRLGRTANNGTQSPASEQESGVSSSPQHDATRDAKTERFHETGRSNSAPDSYDWHTSGR